MDRQMIRKRHQRPRALLSLSRLLPLLFPNSITAVPKSQAPRAKENSIEMRRPQQNLGSPSQLLWRPQQNPSSPSTPQPGSSRGAPPPLSPPFSRRAFDAAASTTIGSERPSVTLDEWWLARVEGHERKIAVGGFFERNQAVLQFTSSPIAKCHEPCTLETEDGIVVFIYGFFNSERTLGNGFTDEACEKFCIGFPYWWEEWSVLYPKMMSSQAGYQPNSSTTSNSHEDGIAPSASMVECTSDEVEVGIDNAPRINEGCRKTPVASLKSQGCLKNLQRIALHDKAELGEATDEQSSEKSVGPSRKQKSALGNLQRAARSPNVISPVPYDKQSLLTRGTLKSYSLSTPESLKLRKTRSGRVVVPPLNSGWQKIIYAPDGSISAIAGLDSPPPLNGSTPKYYARRKKRAN